MMVRSPLYTYYNNKDQSRNQHYKCQHDNKTGSVIPRSIWPFTMAHSALFLHPTNGITESQLGIATIIRNIAYNTPTEMPTLYDYTNDRGPWPGFPTPIYHSTTRKTRPQQETSRDNNRSAPPSPKWNELPWSVRHQKSYTTTYTWNLYQPTEIMVLYNNYYSIGGFMVGCIGPYILGR